MAVLLIYQGHCLGSTFLVLMSEPRSCVKVEVAVLGSPSLIILTVSVDVKRHWTCTGLHAWPALAFVERSKVCFFTLVKLHLHEVMKEYITVRKRQSWLNHTTPWCCMETRTRISVTVRRQQRQCPSFVVSSFCLQGGLSVFILPEKEEKREGKKHVGLITYFFIFFIVIGRTHSRWALAVWNCAESENPRETEWKRVERFQLNNTVQNKLWIWRQIWCDCFSLVLFLLTPFFCWEVILLVPDFCWEIILLVPDTFVEN